MTRPVPTTAAVVLAVFACSGPPPPAGDDFELAPGLELTLWASEPLVVNPTNFDIDERGRVWFIESVNYRSDLKGQPRNDETGDRIVILEDTDKDGRADSRKVFDQHPEMLAPLGISVFGDKVVVSQSPDILVYTRDESDRILAKETLLTGWGGVDHDHGLHAVLFGHDGRYYFNSGDQGFETTDRSGGTFRSSRDGPHYAATVQTVNPDGTDFRVLAHNARNPYEIALDSFGSIWQTDNDDDGNQWTRLLYVMEGADFGYWGPGGRRWREDRGTHFHEERPGTVPYVARTGPGSPTGLVVYEGTLLPERYRGHLLHTEPGKRLVQTFLVRRNGAGFSTDTENTVISTDPLFRPSDIAVAPDGAVFVADWQDPVVGGHNMQDIEQGRIFRLAPVGNRPSTPELDLETDDGLLAAFGSPNQATRYRGYQELTRRGREDRLRILSEAWRSGEILTRARALWMLAPAGDLGAKALSEAESSDDPRFRILALRVARLHGLGLANRIRALANDPDPQVRREAAVLLPTVNDPARVAIWMDLAEGYDGSDRWYLSALGLAAAGAEDAIFRALRAKGATWTSKLVDLYRVLQAPASVPYLAGILRDRSNPLERRLEALNAVGWRPEESVGLTVAAIVANDREDPDLRNRGLYFLGKQLYSEWSDLRMDSRVLLAVSGALRDRRTRAAALELAEAMAHPIMEQDLRQIAEDETVEEADRIVAVRALGRLGSDSVAAVLRAYLANGPVGVRVAAVEGLRAVAPPDLHSILREVVFSDAPNELRSAALRTLGRTPPGQHLILDLEESSELPAELRATAASVVHASRSADVRARAMDVLPPPKSRNQNAVIRVREIVEGVGNAERGRAVYDRKDGANCQKCHSLSVGEEIVGPSLAGIATKYGKEGMLNAILHPSDGIAPEYVSWILDTTTHGLVTGLLVEDTPDRVVLRTEAAERVELAPSDILQRRQGKLSIMPDDLVSAMTKQELVDLLVFLSTLDGRGPGPGAEPDQQAGS